MSRAISTSTLIFDQIVIRAVGGARIAGALHSQFTLRVFLNGALQSWTISSGSGVQNASISAGTLYFQEIPGASGFYSVRLFIPGPGFWTFSLQYNPTPQEVVLEFDASSSSPDCSSGTIASFT